MDNFNFSETFLEIAYEAVIMSSLKTKIEHRRFELICEVCNKYKISVKSFLELINELSKRLEELNDND